MNLVFVCVHNSCRSQMAEALAKYFAQEMGLSLQIYSAGSEKSREIHPKAKEYLKELYGISLQNHYVKTLDELPLQWDIIISMGCNMQCPSAYAKYHFDFALQDPSDMDKEQFLSIIATLEGKTKALLKAIKENTLEEFVC